MSGVFNMRRRLRSFVYAFAGLRALLTTQPNAWIHLLASLLVLVLAIVLPLARWELALLTAMVAAVWVAEAMNTAIESIADACHPEQHPLIKQAKDVAAAGVLLTAVASVVVAVIVFFPYLQPLI